MSPVTHIFTGWVLANTAPLNRRERAVVTLAAVAPDIDGVGAIAEVLTRNSAHPLLWFSRYHHSLHTLSFALVVAVFAYFFARRGWLACGMAFAAFHLHLLEDVVGARGPDGYSWPIPYLMPFSDHWQWSWRGEWALNAWPNVVLTIVLLAIALWLARKRGFSPVEMISAKSDAAVVGAMRGKTKNDFLERRS
jgi:hypothetical protein